MDDLGAPSSYLALEPGTPVRSSDGRELGRVEHVLADADADLFDGIVLDTSALPGGHRFVDADRVEAIHERAVVLTIDAAAARELPEPSANPASIGVNPGDEAGESELKDKLRRAWDLISGKG